jgi:hypothetical protein
MKNEIEESSAIELRKASNYRDIIKHFYGELTTINKFLRERLCRSHFVDFSSLISLGKMFFEFKKLITMLGSNGQRRELCKI